MKESDYVKKSQNEQENIGNSAEINQEKLPPPPMPEKSAFTFHHNFYPKPKVKLKDGIISDETKEKLQVLKQNYNHIVSQHNSNIGLIHLEEMVIETNPELPPIVSAVLLPLKHNKFIKEEIENLLEARIIKRSMSPYGIPVIAVQRKCKSDAPLTETKRLVIDYQELDKQIPKIQMTQAKSKGSLALIKMAKKDHIWSRLKGEKYFTILDIRSGYHISIHPDSKPKNFPLSIQKLTMETSSIWSAIGTLCVSKFNV